MQRAAPIRSDELHPGDLIAGKYRVRTILGRSHGLLVEAFHTDFDQRVVIKVLLPGSVDDIEIERFRREARTLAKLESEHVARIIDVGHQSDGSFYLVRQYLEGTDLGTHLRRMSTLRLQDAVLFVLQAAEAVAETHSHGIILRELQPSHLFLTARAGGAPLVKVIDFGTAKLMRDAAAPNAGGELTATTMFGMSPYSSPELVRKAKNVDLRTDVWSLGAILYELLTGRPPFSGEMAMLMLQITKEEPPPPSHLVSGLPPEIDQIIGWCLAKDVDGRFMNVHAFAHALTPYASPEGLVLIERIGQITQAAKQRKKVGSVPPPVPKPRASSPRAASQEESVTNVKSVTNAAEEAEPFERTIFMGGDYKAAVAPPQPTKRPQPPTLPGRSTGPVFAGAAAGVPAFPAPGQAHPTAPPGSQGMLGQGTPGQAHPTAPPGSQGMLGQGAPGQAHPTAPPGSRGLPGGSLLGPSPQFEAQRPAWPAADGNNAPPSTGLGVVGSTGPHPASVAAPANAGLYRKLTIGAIGAVAVFLPVLAVILIVRSRGAETTVTAPESGAPLTIPAPEVSVALPVPTETPPVPTASAEVVAASPPPATSAAAAPPATTVASKGGPSSPPPAKTGASTAAPPPTATTPPKSGGDSGGTGMLVAVAVGGSCAFSVNGAAKGTTSTLKLPLKPGSYSVSCKPASGATKSRSVSIKSGETAMAMFKLQ